MTEELFGGLITFENKEKLEEFNDSMDKDLAIKILELSIEYGLKNGIYNLDEAVCLYRSISKIKD
jgi:hypothetical protein